jgi:hypothetical protein
MRMTPTRRARPRRYARAVRKNLSTDEIGALVRPLAERLQSSGRNWHGRLASLDSLWRPRWCASGPGHASEPPFQGYDDLVQMCVQSDVAFLRFALDIIEGIKQIPRNRDLREHHEYQQGCEGHARTYLSASDKPVAQC